MKRFLSLLIALSVCASSVQAQAPDILRFEPKTGTTGTTVKIFGRNFASATKVRFGTVLAKSFSVINDSTIAAVVGTGASGLIQVNNPNGEDTLGYFTFVQANPLPVNCDLIRSFVPVINEIKTDLQCFRDSIIKLRVTNGEFKSYRWSNGDTTPYTYVKNTGPISVTVGNSPLGCFSKPATVKFVKNTRPVPQLTYKDSVLTTAPPAPYYRWYFNGQLVGDGQRLKASKIGTYRVETTDDKVCWTSSKEFPVTVGSLVPAGDSLALKIYPNPSNGPFTVAIILPSLQTVKIQITITDVAGSIVYRSPKLTMTGREISIPLEILKKGMYRVKAEVNEKVRTKVLFIQ